ncbi:MAG: HD family phosphohydrolase [Bacteroidales bacterium]|nr:HD family phosphohydrolase [Bacteroidales bacterium]
MNRTRFEETLLKTERKGIDNVLSQLDQCGFYNAPASTRFHLACKGGLLQHSLNVYDAAIMLREPVIQREPHLEPLLPLDSIAITTLLHDTCKSDIYQEAILSRKNADGFWEKYPGYTVDYTAGLPLGHGEKSVVMLLSWGLELKPEEMMAIRWHMTAWNLPFQSPEHKESLNAAKKLSPLVSLVQLADGVASGLLEWEA